MGEPRSSVSNCPRCAAPSFALKAASLSSRPASKSIFRPFRRALGGRDNHLHQPARARARLRMHIEFAFLAGDGVDKR